MFNDYYSARMYFQRKKDTLDERKLRQMIDPLKDMVKKAIYINEKHQILDLILDIEDQIDNMTNVDLMLHLRRQEVSPEQRRGKVAEERSRAFGVGKQASKRGVLIKEDQEATISFMLGDNERDLLNRIEKEIIKMALKYFDGNRSRAADLVGLSVRGLRDRMYRYNLATKG